MAFKYVVVSERCPRCEGTGRVLTRQPVKVKKAAKPAPLQPLSEALRSRLPSLSRAARYQAIRIEHGLCAQCGKEPISPDSKRYGLRCLKKFRARYTPEARR